jgi:ATP-dependent helicase/nuclease subunit B
MKAAVEALDIPLADSDCSVSAETAKELFGDKLSISQSRLETYSRCHFNYFCDYVLGLREDSRAEFAASQTGDFIHHVMEKFMRESIRDGHFNSDFSDDEAIELARGAQISREELMEMLNLNYEEV